jgi:nitroreductase
MKEAINSKDSIIVKASEFYTMMSQRRSIRRFNCKRIPLQVIKECVKAAATAPSGANKQP